MPDVFRRDVFRVAQPDPNADRATFASGTEPLDRYFREQVSQDIKRRIAACFVATDPAGRIAGFYTLAAAGFYAHHGFLVLSAQPRALFLPLATVKSTMG